jgi:hypothetical protein
MKDLLLSSNNDFQIVNNDLFIGKSDLQHQKHLLISNKGEIKHAPVAGVGLFTFLADNNKADLNREIRLDFSADGMKVESVSTDKGEIKIDAPYED